MNSNNSNLLNTPNHGSTAASKEGTVKWTKGHYVTSKGKVLTPHNNNENVAREVQKQLNKTAKNKKKNTPKREKTREEPINNIKKEIYKKAAISNNMRNRGVEPYEPNSPAAIAAFRKDVNTATLAAAKVLANAKAVGNTRRKPTVTPLRKRPQVAPKRETSLERNLRLVAESQTPTDVALSLHNNMSSMITKMTVPELKETLTARGLSTKGLKADLVKRLLTAIKENNK
jgi:Asp-tRNA(Asn)/Glu-tRNA(Gln) amidotransferase C subunit